MEQDDPELLSNLPGFDSFYDVHNRCLTSRYAIPRISFTGRQDGIHNVRPPSVSWTDISEQSTPVGTTRQFSAKRILLKITQPTNQIPDTGGSNLNSIKNSILKKLRKSSILHKFRKKILKLCDLSISELRGSDKMSLIIDKIILVMDTNRGLVNISEFLLHFLYVRSLLRDKNQADLCFKLQFHLLVGFVQLIVGLKNWKGCSFPDWIQEAENTSREFLDAFDSTMDKIQKDYNKNSKVTIELIMLAELRQKYDSLGLSSFSTQSEKVTVNTENTTEDINNPSKREGKSSANYSILETKQPGIVQLITDVISDLQLSLTNSRKRKATPKDVPAPEERVEGARRDDLAEIHLRELEQNCNDDTWLEEKFLSPDRNYISKSFTLAQIMASCTSTSLGNPMISVDQSGTPLGVNDTKSIQKKINTGVDLEEWIDKCDKDVSERLYSLFMMGFAKFKPGWSFEKEQDQNRSRSSSVHPPSQIKKRRENLKKEADTIRNFNLLEGSAKRNNQLMHYTLRNMEIDTLEVILNHDFTHEEYVNQIAAKSYIAQNLRQINEIKHLAFLHCAPLYREIERLDKLQNKCSYVKQER